MSFFSRIFTGRRQTNAFPSGNQGSTAARPALTPQRAAIPLPFIGVIPHAETLDPTEQKIVAGEWLALGSSWQEELRWDVRSKWTYWNTKNGARYVYTKPMELPIVKAWFQSDSPGRYWWSNVRGVYSPATVLQQGTRGQRGTPNVIRTHRGPRNTNSTRSV